jgi:hypothetical protein
LYAGTQRHVPVWVEEINQLGHNGREYGVATGEEEWIPEVPSRQ